MRDAFSQRSAPRWRRADARAGEEYRARDAIAAAVSGRVGAGDLRHGLLLGRGEEILAARWRLLDRGGIRRRVHPETHPSRGLLPRDRARRSGAGGLRPQAPLLPPAPASLLGTAPS